MGSAQSVVTLIERYKDVPAEMRVLNNSCVAGNNRADPLQHKAPQYWNNDALKLADHGDPRTWMMFEDALGCAQWYETQYNIKCTLASVLRTVAG